MWAIVDDDMFGHLNQWKWSAIWVSRTKKFYVLRTIYLENKKVKSILMHREVMRTPEGFETDHINGNTLDNRKQNLRIATRSQNAINSPKRTNNSSGFKGVHWHKAGRKWSAQITLNKKIMHLGSFVSKIAAAKVYNDAATRYFGKFANLNLL